MQKEKVSSRPAPPPPQQEGGNGQTQINIDGADKMQALYGDGWQNVLRGTGIPGRDPRMSTNFSATTILTEGLLLDLYRGEGMAKRIVDLPAADMVREWFTVNGDTDGSLVKSMDDYDARDSMLRAVKWSRLYGGAIIVMGIDDGGELQDELNEDNIRRIEFLKIYEKPLVSRSTVYDDPSNVKFGKVELWQVNPVSGSPFQVHETRVLELDGVDVPSRSRAQRDGWGDSVLQSVYTRVRGLGDAYGGIEQIIAEFIIGTLTFDNLQELIANGQEDLVRKRLNIIDMSKHILNTVLVDKEEKYSRISATVGGLDGLLGKLEQALSSVTGIPVTLLMGQSPAGLSATGASDIRFYYDTISAMQETTLRTPDERLTYLTMRSKEGPTKGVEIDEWSVKFVSLWQPTEAETVGMRKEQAETDERYINTGVLDPVEVAISRFGGDEYSIETTLGEERLAALESGETGETGEGDE